MNLQTTIKAIMSVGAVLGRIIFGWLADVLDRKKMYRIELIILVVSTLTQALSGHGPMATMVGLLIFRRIAIGLGIRGGHPMSAVITTKAELSFCFGAPLRTSSMEKLN